MNRICLPFGLHTGNNKAQQIIDKAAYRFEFPYLHTLPTPYYFSVNLLFLYRVHTKECCGFSSEHY
jgi:hypothetical protein